VDFHFHAGLVIEEAVVYEENRKAGKEGHSAMDVEADLMRERRTVGGFGIRVFAAKCVSTFSRFHRRRHALPPLTAVNFEIGECVFFLFTSVPCRQAASCRG